MAFEHTFPYLYYTGYFPFCQGFAAELSIYYFVAFWVAIAYNISEREWRITHHYRFREEEMTMATSSFERKLEVTDPKAIARLAKIMSDQTPAKPITHSTSSRKERKRCEELLKQCPLRSPR